jgi:hypothetical protein
LVIDFGRSCDDTSIVQRWGGGAALGQHVSHYWHDATAHRRAWETSCGLVFDRSEALDALLSSLPLDAIGSDANALARATGAKATGDRLTWTVALPAHVCPPSAKIPCTFELEAVIVRGVVRTIHFVTPMWVDQIDGLTGYASFDMLLARLDGKLGTPDVVSHNASAVCECPEWTWRSTPAAKLVNEFGVLQATIGTR